MSAPEAPEPRTFLETLAGPELLSSGPLRRFLGWSVGRRVVVAVAVLASLLFIPYLGAVGLGDPWETHYGEVGREMLERHDLVFPYWESSPFYSKPPLTMWLDAIGMAVVGTNRTEGRVALYTEWGMRLPTALLVIASLCLLAYALTRTVGKRVGLTSAFILATMPLYFILARQVITDTPFEACFVGAMSCALIGLFDEKTQHRSAWWYGFYALMGISTLAKELVGVLIGGAALLLYACLMVIPWSSEGMKRHWAWLTRASVRQQVRAGTEEMPELWAEMFRMRFLTGLIVFLAFAGPWLLTMALFANGKEAEGETFLYRYFVHDQLARLASGVHSTERNPTFAYFIEQGGYALFTWVALVPGTLAVALRLKIREKSPRTQVAVLALLWTLVGFGVVAASATKFPHYLFPTLPAVAILMAFFVEDLWEEGVVRHALALLTGLVLFALVARDLVNGPTRDGRDYMGVATLSGGLKSFTDLYIYNHDRPYPEFLVTEPLRTWGGSPLTLGHLAVVALLAVGAFLFVDSFQREGKKADVPGRIAGAVLFGLALVAWGVGSQGGDSQLVAKLHEQKNLRDVLGYAFLAAGALFGWCLIWRSRTGLFASYSAFVVAFALWFSWSHWVNLSHHWSQRDLFFRYYAKRQPSEPIAAFLMDWKGETFYSRNTVKQIKTNEKMNEYISLPGRKWSLVEQGSRFESLKRMAAGHNFQTYDARMNAKFVLVSID